MSEPNERANVTIWHLLQEASYHLQNPPPGGWEHPEDVDKVRQLLQRDPGQVRESDGEGTPLHKAAYWCLPAIAEVLLQAGADPNSQTDGAWTPLHQAVKRSQNEDADIRLIQILLDHGADPNLAVNRETPQDIAWGRAADLLRERVGTIDLNNACRLGLVEDVKRILAADPDAITKAKNPQWLISDTVTVSGIHGKEDDGLEIVSLLLKHGANVNGTGAFPGTPLYCACNGSPDSVIRLLLLHGADVNSASYNGETPLQMARQCKRHAVVEMLIQAGAH